MPPAESVPALEVHGLCKSFGGARGPGRRRPLVHAVREVSFRVARGETLGIVGESGCGKSTLARMLVGSLRPSAGRIVVDGVELGDGRVERIDLARRIQYVFQDPISSLNPRKRIGRILETPLERLHGLGRVDRRARAVELAGAVGLPASLLERYPHELSGGQAQRVGIARALAAEPAVLVLDEPVSALDVSVQAQVLNLLAALRERLGLTYLFISHDLAVVESISDRVAVLYAGRLVEHADAVALFARPRHPYTALLASSAPVPGRALARVPREAAEPPDPLASRPGCAFAPRCPRATSRCRDETPPLVPLTGASHAAACFHPLD